MKAGKVQGRKTGFAAGRAKGEEEGREAGYSSGYAEGRATALGGLTPGGWYVLQIGSDANGPVVSGATPVAVGVLLRAQRRLGAERTLLTCAGRGRRRERGRPRRAPRDVRAPTGA